MSTSNTHDLDKNAIQDDLTLPRVAIHNIASEGTQSSTCPHCQTPHAVGELVCNQCGILFSSSGKTNKLEVAPSQQSQGKKDPVGTVSVKEDRPIYLYINGRTIQLPLHEAVIVGRRSTSPDAPQPDVALNDFGAEEKGVSRHHVRITRHGDILYIADMGSSNGSFLNGRPLLRNLNRVIRDGDDLQLGFLKLRIHF